MPEVVTLREESRGCGFRKPSAGGVGIYLVGGALSAFCGKLPLPLSVCPTCSAGIKPSRGWTWVDPQHLFAAAPPCGNEDPLGRRRGGTRALAALCQACPVGAPPPGRHGLLWVGEKFYRPDEFVREAGARGISRKISAIPKGFALGETWVYLAHRHAISRAAPDEEPTLLAGIFSAFKPTGIDLVIDGSAPVPEKAERLAESLGAGVRIVVVERVGTDSLKFGEE